MELERMHGRRRQAAKGGTNMEHLNLSLPLHVQVPPLPSPNTTAAAATLFRVNQSAADGFSFKKLSPAPQKKAAKRQRAVDTSAVYTAHQAPTPTTAAAAAAAIMLSNATGATLASPTAAETTAKQDEKTSETSQAEHGSEAGTNGTRRRVGVPKFLRYLFQMLEYEDRKIIAWSHDGTAFQIRDPAELAEHVLPKYFKHNKVSSFQRQLNYFGFKKWTKTQTNICTFSHPNFIRDEQDKMRLIKRKERSTRGQKGAMTAGGKADEDDGEDGESDEPPQSLVGKPPPGKRAKTTGVAAAKRPVSAVPHREQIKRDTAQNGKPPRPRKSPTMKPTVTSQPELEPVPLPVKAKTGTPLPAISPGALSTVSPSHTSALGRFVGNSRSPSPNESAYNRPPVSEAAAVMPVHADMMIQQQQQNSMYGRRLSNPYDTNSTAMMTAIPDLSTAFNSSQSSNWQAQAQGDGSAYGLSAFKFPESTTPFDLAPSQGTYSANGSQGPSVPNAKDYLDVLLESAAMDDQLSGQSTTGSNDSAIAAAWEASYQAAQQQQTSPNHSIYSQVREQVQADRRLAAEAAMATYSMLSPPQHPNSSSMQLPSIEDLQGNRY